MARPKRDEAESTKIDVGPPFGIIEQAQPETPAAPTSVQVMLLCDHVYLPHDPTTVDWAKVETRRYDGEVNGRRARVECHPELAEFLQGRKQAEII